MGPLLLNRFEKMPPNSVKFQVEYTCKWHVSYTIINGYKVLMVRIPDTNDDPAKINSRWVGYFDLLGTSQLINSGRIIEVFSAYQEALDKLKQLEDTPS